MNYFEKKKIEVTWSSIQYQILIHTMSSQRKTKLEFEHRFSVTSPHPQRTWNFCIKDPRDLLQMVHNPNKINRMRWIWNAWGLNVSGILFLEKKRRNIYGISCSNMKRVHSNFLRNATGSNHNRKNSQKRFSSKYVDGRRTKTMIPKCISCKFKWIMVFLLAHSLVCTAAVINWHSNGLPLTHSHFVQVFMRRSIPITTIIIIMIIMCRHCVARP